LVAVVDYGVGNIGSVTSMLDKIGASWSVTSSPEGIEAASKLILPGVGHYDKAVHELHQRGLMEPLHQAALQDRKPTLGICLGAQLMGIDSEEGQLQGLGWVKMRVRRFPSPSVRVPHMGWNWVEEAKPGLLPRMTERQRYYFVHSYYMDCLDLEDVAATSEYGQKFVSAFRRDNISGVQFHPEKSHRFGLNLLREFVGA